MFEPREDARFVAEPLFDPVARDRVRHLDRDVAAERLVVREVDRAHAAAPDLARHDVAVRDELGPDGDRLQAGHRGVGQERHSTSTPNSSRASRRYSSRDPVSPSSAASACWRKLRRTCAR